eukprot:m.166597 g.166597  ORF g.166597 m.166597 type:complete len:340 (+) comp12710_c0_seq1:105-1124(+)
MSVASMNYCPPHAEPSLYRNGKMGIARDGEGTDSVLPHAISPINQKFERATVKVAIDNARTLPSPMSLERNGFELRSRRSLPINYYSWNDTVHKYYKECEAAVQEATGARWVYAFDHNLRSRSHNRRAARQVGTETLGRQGLVQTPIPFVHGDYTLRSAPERLQQLAKPPGHNDTLRELLGDRPLLPPHVLAAATAPGARWGIINVWRNISDKPVQAYPLACTDGKTVRRDELCTYEIHYSDRIGENYLAKHNPRHKWYYYPHMTRDEILLLKQWDTEGTLAQSGGDLSDYDGSPDSACTFSFHSAVDQPPAPGAPDRESIEVRCLVVWNPKGSSQSKL